MEKFFRDVMFKESAIYTLLGTKPATVIVLTFFTDEEIDAWLANMSEEEKKDLIIHSEAYDLPENWQKWEKIQSQFPISKYLLFKKDREPGAKTQEIYFVNILQTALLFQEHYAFFKKHIGDDFDPFEEAINIQNDSSFVWYSDSIVLGMLFGFGLKNSSCFEWKHWTNTENNPHMETFLSTLKFRAEEHGREFADPTINNFSLPHFASFSPKGKDPVIERYKREREEIKAQYRGKDFLDFTLEQLTAQ